MREERYQELIPCRDVTPHILGLPLGSPPSPRPVDTARAPSPLRGLVRLQPMGPGPIPETSGSPSPSHRLLRQGGWGESAEKRDSLAGGAPSSRGGAGAEEGAGSAAAGWRAGAGGGVSAAAGRRGDKFSAPRPRALTWVPAQAPGRGSALRGSARQPAGIGPPGLPHLPPRGRAGAAAAAPEPAGEREGERASGAASGPGGGRQRAGSRASERASRGSK